MSNEAQETPPDGIGGPHLMVAIMTDELVYDDDGKPIDYNGISMTAVIPTDPTEQVWIRLFVVLVGGDYRGPGTIDIEMIVPFGDRFPMPSDEITFGDSIKPVFSGTEFGLTSPMEGLWWFEISFDGRVLTRVPFLIMGQDSFAA